ncbi:MAG: hypothetical protein DI536_33820 [Archangium gephyra]|uniref:Uncharacterized protein n=1 Tax=Archangium gephyra TaxID=48 RepID=A0A2W5U6W7_9BACT|nr:MAG: hypothetical protein DI536_33820 [Archangium gephyra]
MNIVDPSEFGTLRPLNVVDYLRTHGWAPLPSPRADVAVLRFGLNGRDVTTRVPLDETFGDYALRMAELADLLSKLEDRPVAQVVNDLATPPGDLVRFRIASEETESGSLGITQSLELRHALKNLLLAAAHSAITPASNFPRLSQQKAVALLEQCRERQSERGSYVASLFVPVLPPVGQLDIDEEFGRKTTRLMFSALSVAARSAVMPETLMQSQQEGVSSNFLEALAELEPPGPRGTIEVSFNWLRGAPGPDFTRPLRFTHESFRNYRQVAKALREQSPISNTELVGYVIHVEKKSPTAERGRFTIASFVEGHGDSRVQVPVDSAQHKAAAEAHAYGRKVRLVGTLVKTGRSLELREHSGVEVLDDAD